MSNKNILNLLLFFVAITLATIIYFSEQKNNELDRLSNIHTDSIHSIKIQHNNNKISLIKTDRQTWNITQPVAIAANDFRINSILKLLNAPVHNDYTPAEIASNQIGLDKPATSIQFNENTITFGIINPVTNLRYIKFNNRIYTIEDVYYPLISSHFGTLVSLHLLPPDSKPAKLVLLNQTIFKDNKGRWASSNGSSADSVASTLQHWLHDQAFGVHQLLQRKNLGEVVIDITSPKQSIRYRITDTDPWLIIARPELGLEYHLDKEAYDLLISPGDGDIDADTSKNR